MARARAARSKAGRNEQRKLIATAANNIAVAFTLASVLQPALSYVQQGRRFDIASVEGLLIFVTIAMLFFLAARSVAAKLEDREMPPLVALILFSGLALGAPFASAFIYDRFFAPRD